MRVELGGGAHWPPGEAGIKRLRRRGLAVLVQVRVDALAASELGLSVTWRLTAGAAEAQAQAQLSQA